MSGENTDLEIKQGKTFRRVLRWESAPIIYKPISAIAKAAPVNIAIASHGIPNGWRATVVSAKGMTQINAVNDPPKLSDYKQVTVIDAGNVQFNDVNSSDFSTHTAGTGYLRFNTPVDMTGYAARMAIKSSIGGALLETLTTENGGIVIDNVNKTISLFISATDTAAYAWVNGVYELEMIGPAGDVSTLISGSITVTREVAT